VARTLALGGIAGTLIAWNWLRLENGPREGQAALMVLLALAPVIYTPVFDLFSFSREKGSGQRLIAVELFALRWFELV